MPTSPVLVVGAALVRDGRVLAARRTHPPDARGLWEFPGGKVEPGELPGDAIVREIREELGCGIRVTGRLTGEQPVTEHHTLQVVLGEIVDGDPVPHEHDAMRWLGPGELEDVPWLAPDLPFLTELREILLGGQRRDGVRALLWEADDARAIAGRLRGRGFDATVARERFAGEDDDEDQPWAVVTDAPAVMVELLLEEYDGWLDDAESAQLPDPPRPLDLPEGPRRVKGHLRDP